MNSSQKVKARLLISQAHDKECYLLEILYYLPLLFMNSCLLVLKGVMVRKGKRKRRFTTCKRRRLNHRTNTDARSWANLLGDMLGERFSEIVGSPYYMAPEVLKRNCGPEIDIWAPEVL
ncbi:hypothetical protein ACSBR1_010907 [Camellia fascicularis]